MKEIEIECPCCEAKLVVDVLTQKVIRHRERPELNEFGKPVLPTDKWVAAEAKIAARKAEIEAMKSDGSDAFDQALSKEKGREKDLDDLFRRAKSKVDRKKKDL